MPNLNVITPGITSVQGLGFYGSQRYGVAPGGAMDRMALAEANALSGQPAGAAAIEIGPFPVSFRVSGGVIRLAFSGALRDVIVDDVAMTVALLEADGWSLEVTIATDDGRPDMFAYMTKPGNARVELTDASRQGETLERLGWSQWGEYLR